MPRECVRTHRLAAPLRALRAPRRRRCMRQQAAGFTARDAARLAPGAMPLAAKLREAYETYCRENGEKRLIHAREFAAALRARGCEPHRRAKGVRGWCGIGLLAHEE